MPWTTAPPTYRSIPSLSPSASPSESALATSLSPTAWKRRRLGCEGAVERAREAAQLDRDAVGSESGRTRCPGVALASGTQHPSGRVRACPGQLIPGAARPDDPRRTPALRRPLGPGSCQALPVARRKLSPGPRANEAAGFPTWDGAPCLGTPRPPRPTCARFTAERCCSRRTDACGPGLAATRPPSPPQQRAGAGFLDEPSSSPTLRGASPQSTVQMQFRLFSFALIILNCMDYSHCQGNRWRRNKRASYVSNPICKGCLSCSKDNGCSRCQQKLFFFLRREGMRQYGECLHSCPSGYYGHRAPDMNRCARCRIENCDSCFSKDFCTKCKVGFYLHRGRCFDECPDGFAPLDETMECVEGCEVGHWSEWGTCSRNNRTCGFKWGLETRTRQIVKKPAKDTIPCPTIAESRRCKMAMRHCPGGKRTPKAKEKRNKKKKRKLIERAQEQHSVFLATDRASQ
uniref:R-spondin-2 n=4 Tax=Euarchontoglires TaxID=314146 RepID=G1SE19_RABIT|nr:R-spondin-2 isoform X1 [Oryctolagus cuniculus]